MTRTFVIGDIHGSHKELNELLYHIFTIEKFDKANDMFLFIGDYVDRGFQSKQVIDQLIKLKENFPNTVFLRGNHEDMFLSWLGLGGMYGSMFYFNGGAATALSYTDDKLPTLSEYRKLPQDEKNKIAGLIKQYDHDDQLKALVPNSHKNFLLNTKFYHDTENILFVHAGVNPYATLKENTAMDLLWVQDNRDRFFRQIDQKPWPKLLIHGHTPIPPNEVKLDLNKNRINVDTGFVYDGSMTCLVVDDSQKPEDWKIIQHDEEQITCTI